MIIYALAVCLSTAGYVPFCHIISGPFPTYAQCHEQLKKNSEGIEYRCVSKHVETWQ